MPSRSASRQTIMLRLDLIDVVARHRPVDTQAVERLAATIKEVGMHTPITVRYMEHRAASDGSSDDSYILVAGAHRLAAAKLNNWEQIECFEVVCNDGEAEIWEIVENLSRLDLTKDERDRQIRRYAELLARDGSDKMSDPSTDSRGRQKTPQQTPGIASKISQDTGLNIRTIQRVLAPVPSAAPVRPVKIADDPINDLEAREKQVATLMSAWNKAAPEAREEFLLRIDRPVMDRRFA